MLVVQRWLFSGVIDYRLASQRVDCDKGVIGLCFRNANTISKSGMDPRKSLNGFIIKRTHSGDSVSRASGSPRPTQLG